MNAAKWCGQIPSDSATLAVPKLQILKYRSTNVGGTYAIMSQGPQVFGISQSKVPAGSNGYHMLRSTFHPWELNTNEPKHIEVAIGGSRHMAWLVPDHSTIPKDYPDWIRCVLRPCAMKHQSLTVKAFAGQLTASPLDHWAAVFFGWSNTFNKYCS